MEIFKSPANNLNSHLLSGSYYARKRPTIVQQLSKSTSLGSERRFCRQIPAFKIHRRLAKGATFRGLSQTGVAAGTLHRPPIWRKPEAVVNGPCKGLMDLLFQSSLNKHKANNYFWAKSGWGMHPIRRLISYHCMFHRSNSHLIHLNLKRAHLEGLRGAQWPGFATFRNFSPSPAPSWCVLPTGCPSKSPAWHFSFHSRFLSSLRSKSSMLLHLWS